MGFRDENNEIVGYDIDLAKEVAKRIGVELVCQPIDWNAKEQELNTGKIDCIWNGFTITSEREAAMTFTKPYLKNAQVLVVRADSKVQNARRPQGQVRRSPGRFFRSRRPRSRQGFQGKPQERRRIQG